jgi:hypothetical protein
LAIVWTVFCWHLAPGADTALPPAAPLPHKIDFAREVVPIFQTSCISCHANGQSKGGFRIDTRELALKGGDSQTPAIVPGHADQSTLFQLINETDPDVVMPKKGSHLTPAQIAMIKAWIDQGASWPDGISPGRFKEASLKPRRPMMPAAAPGSGLTNPIDLMLQPYFAEHHIDCGAVVDDRTFARRVYLDVIGLLPSPDDLKSFETSPAADKRELLVHRLLGDDRRYAEHWISFWNDLLRNDYQGTGYIDGGRKQITGWLFNALKTNMPYDQFVRELVSGNNGTAGFTRGIVWRGTINAAQTPPMQAAQNISQVFMGINLKCASCHDSFVSNWKLTDSYGLASVYADGPLEMQRCDVPTGKIAPLKFLYPQLGRIDPKSPRADRIAQLGRIITSPDNGRLTRTIVNRLWQKCMGRGLIEPTDDMDADPWDADLLDELAVQFSDHGYDIRAALAGILTSRAYQMPAVVQQTESDEQFVFHGPLIRRMTAEQFVDAIATVTDIWPAKPATRPAMEGTPAAPEIRSALCTANPLTVAMGRPNREQVVTERPTAATTLQALEMTNGATLAAMLHNAAVKMLATPNVSTDEIIRHIYQKSLGRDATSQELATAREEVGSPPKVEGVEDLLWAVFMLPEFQLIR